jgi:pimeloyl-ACP methyl ester carboxylesterase
LRTPVYIDATAAAPNVKSPTLVMRHAQHPFVTAEVARNVTASIPGASLITIPGLWADDPAANVTDRSLDWALTP